jgi:hypothetical protein
MISIMDNPFACDPEDGDSQSPFPIDQLQTNLENLAVAVDTENVVDISDALVDLCHTLDHYRAAFTSDVLYLLSNSRIMDDLGACITRIYPTDIVELSLLALRHLVTRSPEARSEILNNGLATEVLAQYISAFQPRPILTNALFILRSIIEAQEIDFLRHKKGWFHRFMEIRANSTDAIHRALFAWLLPSMPRLFPESIQAIFREAGLVLQAAQEMTDDRERGYVQRWALETFLQIKRSPGGLGEAFLQGDRLDFLVRNFVTMADENARLALEIITCCYRLDVREHETLSRAAARRFKIQNFLRFVESSDDRCQTAALKALCAMFKYDQDLIEPALEYPIGNGGLCDLIMDLLPAACSRVKGWLLQLINAILHFAPPTVSLDGFLTPELVELLRDSLSVSPKVGSSAKIILVTLMHLASLRPDLPEECMNELEQALAEADSNPDFPGHLRVVHSE